MVCGDTCPIACTEEPIVRLVFMSKVHALCLPYLIIVSFHFLLFDPLLYRLFVDVGRGVCLGAPRTYVLANNRHFSFTAVKSLG